MSITIDLDKADFDIVQTVCKIWDTETQEFWKTPKGKTQWKAKNHAANAVNANPPDWLILHSNGRYVQDYIPFSKQTRLVVVNATYTLSSIQVL